MHSVCQHWRRGKESVGERGEKKQKAKNKSKPSEILALNILQWSLLETDIFDHINQM